MCGRGNDSLVQMRISPPSLSLSLPLLEQTRKEVTPTESAARLFSITVDLMLTCQLGAKEKLLSNTHTRRRKPRLSAYFCILPWLERNVRTAKKKGEEERTRVAYRLLIPG